ERHLTRQEADSLILRSYEEGLIGARLLPSVIDEWRKPSYEDFTDGSAWSLWNCFTTILGRTTQANNPAKAAATTIKLQRLMSPEVIDVECTIPRSERAALPAPAGEEPTRMVEEVRVG